MNIYGKIKRLIRNLSLTDPKAWDSSLWNFVGSQTLSGENVNEYTALTSSAVYNAVSLISGTIGALPLHLMQHKDKEKHTYEKKPIYRVMHDQANDFMTAMALRETLMAHVLTWGNGYAEIVRNVMGDVVALWPIPPNRCTPAMAGGRIIYNVRVDNETIPIIRESILHIPGLGFDGLVGYSVIAMARKSIGLGMALESFGSLYFGQGTHPGVIVTHPGQLNPEAHKNLKTSLTDAYSGLGNSHRMMLLEDGMKMENLGIPPNDSQFLESRLFQIPEIARWFNLPPHKLKDLTKSSFNNIEAEQTSFVRDTILPWLVRLEQNYNMQLLSPSDKSLTGYGKLYFKHIVEGLLRGDAISRGQYYQIMINIGAMTRNEVRDKEDLNPDPNPLADELFVMTNMMPLSKYEESLKESAEPDITKSIVEDEDNGQNTGKEPIQEPV